MIKYKYQLQTWLMIILIVGILLITGGCKTQQIIPADYSTLSSQVEDISKADNITPEQKIILQHTVNGLKQADITTKENTELRKEVISSSKATSRVVYVIIGGLVIITLISGVLRIMRPI